MTKTASRAALRAETQAPVMSSVDSRLMISADGAVAATTPEGAARPMGSIETESLAAILKRSLEGGKPRHLSIQFSTQCSLRCRMCGPGDSSKWAEDWTQLERLGREIYRRPPGVGPYGLKRLSERAYGHLTSDAALWAELRTLAVLGGEPMEEPLALRFLQARPNAAADLSLTTNALSVSPAWTEALASFASVRVGASAEATGALYRYVRGREFDEFAEGVARLRAIAGASIAIRCAISTFTVFGAADLLKWARGIGLADGAFQASLVEFPRFLNPWSLPIEARDRAALRLREAGLTEALAPEVFAALERDERSEDEQRIQQFQEFLEYATDLDRLRGERLVHAAPEVIQLEKPQRGGARRGGLTWPSRK